MNVFPLKIRSFFAYYKFFDEKFIVFRGAEQTQNGGKLKAGEEKGLPEEKVLAAEDEEEEDTCWHTELTCCWMSRAFSACRCSFIEQIWPIWALK